MTPRKEAEELIASAWDLITDPAIPDRNAKVSALLREALPLLDLPPGQERVHRSTEGVRTPVESHSREWWPTVARCADSLGVSGPAVSSVLGKPDRSCGGRKLWRSKYRTREAFLASLSSPQTKAVPRTAGAA